VLNTELEFQLFNDQKGRTLQHAWLSVGVISSGRDPEERWDRMLGLPEFEPRQADCASVERDVQEP
jgi:hypothetical protein